jgi:hypothetical protein
LGFPKLPASAATNMTASVVMEHIKPDFVSILRTAPHVVQLEDKGKNGVAVVMASVGLQPGVVSVDR